MPETRDHRCYDQLFIGGHWRKPSTEQRLTVISPHSEKPIGDVPAATPEDVDAAVAAARHAFDHGPWPRLTRSERMRKVEELATIYGGHLDEMADLITDEMGSPRSFSRLGQAAAAASMIHLTLAVARDFPWIERRHGVLGEVHLHRAPVGRGRCDRAMERAAVLDHAQADSRPDRGLHGHRQTRARNTFGRFVVGRDDRAAGPARRGGVRASRRHRCRRGAGAPSRRRQDLVHRVERGRTPHRHAVRRATQAGEPGTRRQVGGDHPRRRRHRQDGQGA